MEELEIKLRRTLLDFLLSASMKDSANAIIDPNLSILYDNFSAYGLSLDVPAPGLIQIQNNDELRNQIIAAAKIVSNGYLEDQNGYKLDAKDISIEFRVKLIEDDAIWQSKMERNVEDEKQTHELAD